MKLRPKICLGGDKTKTKNKNMYINRFCCCFFYVCNHNKESKVVSKSSREE